MCLHILIDKNEVNINTLKVGPTAFLSFPFFLYFLHETNILIKGKVTLTIQKIMAYFNGISFLMCVSSMCKLDFF